MGLFGGDNSSGQQAAMMSMGLRQIGQTAGLTSLNAGADKARADLTGHSYFQPQYDAAYGSRGSLGMIQNALGLNGADGSKTALDAFQAGPGYQFQMDQGVQAQDRSAASRGMLASGGHQQELTQYGQGLANQNWQQWLSNLGGTTQLGAQAASGLTGQQNTLANLDYGHGRDQAGIFTSTQNGAAQDLTSGMNADASARNQQSANLFGGIMGGLKLGAGALTAPMTGGTSLFGMMAR